MDPYVRTMHERSGLLEELDGGVTLAEAEAQVLAYVKEHCADGSRPPLAGNTVATDRSFLIRDMPTLEAFLHYRIVDVSSIKELSAAGSRGRTSTRRPKRGNHRALADIQESIEELRYYREAVFVAPPGPDSESAKALAAKHGGALTGLGPDAVDERTTAADAGLGTDAGRRIPRRGPAPSRLHSASAPLADAPRSMVGVAQLVERRVVVADVAGSSPVTHPKARRPSPSRVGRRRASGVLEARAPPPWGRFERKPSPPDSTALGGRVAVGARTRRPSRPHGDARTPIGNVDQSSADRRLRRARRRRAPHAAATGAP